MGRRSTGKKKEKELLKAAESGCVDAVKIWFEDHPDVPLENVIHSDGTTALHIASQHGHVTVVRELLHRVSSADLRGLRYKSALHDAAAGGHAAIVACLIQHGAIVNCHSTREWTPLHRAAQAGRIEVSRMLLLSGADAALTNSYGEAALFLAARGTTAAHTAVVRLLLPVSDLRHRTTRGETALLVAGRKGTPESLQILIEATVNAGSLDDVLQDVDLNGYSLAHCVCASGNPDSLVVFLRFLRGLPVDAAMKSLQKPSFDGTTPLHVAATSWEANHRSVDVVSILLGFSPTQHPASLLTTTTYSTCPKPEGSHSDADGDDGHTCSAGAYSCICGSRRSPGENPAIPGRREGFFGDY
eukprot:Rmarinus@m.10819